MRLVVFFTALALSCGYANAQEQKEQDVSTGVGQGIICDTQQQAERYVELRDGGAAAVKALHAVNEEAENPTACGAAMVAFTGGKPLTEKALQGKTVMIVKIFIVAANDGMSWAPAGETIQYTIISRPGLNI